MAGVAALLLALATAAGALGAHLLRARWSEAQLALLQTAVHYQFFNSLGLLLLAQLAEARRSVLLQRAAQLLLAGVLLFSGSLYLLAAGAPRWLGVVTPLGGLCLIGAWLLAAYGLWRRSGGG